MKILLYSGPFPPAIGGMERCAEELATWLSEKCHDVLVVTRTPADQGGDRSRSYRVLRRPSAPRLVRAMQWADVVHINGLSLRGLTPAIAARRPAVVTHQGHQAICPTGLAWIPHSRCDAGFGRPGPCAYCPGAGPLGTMAVWIHRQGAHAARQNVCVSRYLEARLSLKRSVAVIGDPVPRLAFSRPAGGPGENRLIAFAGRLVAEKGLDILLKALTQVPDARLEIAGDGPMRPTWEHLAEEIGIARRVCFLGALSFAELADLYARAAVVCCPSAWGEPFGGAMVEAMAMGRPVVVTPNGVLPEHCENGRGFVAASSTPGALADALCRALADPITRRIAGKLARDYALKEFSLEVVGARYLKLYQQAAH